jgi:hypothetical protein
MHLEQSILMLRMLVQRSRPYISVSFYIRDRLLIAELSIRLVYPWLYLILVRMGEVDSILYWEFARLCLLVILGTGR